MPSYPTGNDNVIWKQSNWRDSWWTPSPCGQSDATYIHVNKGLCWRACVFLALNNCGFNHANARYLCHPGNSPNGRLCIRSWTTSAFQALAWKTCSCSTYFCSFVDQKTMAPCLSITELPTSYIVLWLIRRNFVTSWCTLLVFWQLLILFQFWMRTGTI